MNSFNTICIFILCVTSQLFGVSTYLTERFLKYIDKDEINSIIELGGYKFDDTLELYQHYNCPIIVFEPNPDLVDEFKHKIAGYKDIKLETMVVSDETKNTSFKICKWAGASSIYEIDYLALGKWNKKTADEMLNLYPMYDIPIKAIRLDDYIESIKNPQIDMICMDVQGAALNVLKGLGDKLKTIKYIITEVEYQRLYKDEALFSEIEKFMRENGFTCFEFVDPCNLFDDVIFIRNDLCKNF